MFTFFNRSIRNKILAIPLVLVVSISISAIIYFPSNKAAELKRSLAEEIDIVADLLSYGFGIALDAGDFKSMQAAYETLKEKKQISYVVILDDKNKVINSYNPGNYKIDMDSNRFGRAAIITKDFIEKTRVIKTATASYGTVIVGMSLGPVKKMVASIIIATLVVSVIFLVLFLFIGFWLSTRITRSLNTVVVTAKKIADEDLVNLTDSLAAASNGDLSKSVEINSREITVTSQDEIGILGKTFNRMIAKFQESGKAVEKLKTSIEQVSAETFMLVNAASEGKLGIRGDTQKFKGTYSKMVDGFNRTLDAVIGPINETNTVLQKVAQRDMTVRMQGHYRGDMEDLKNAVNTSVDNLDKALQQVGQGTEQVSSASQQISAGSQSLAQGANEQASSLEEVSSSLVEMSSMTKQNAENANQAKNLAGNANDNAAQGKQAMERMSESINKIKNSADQTAKIVKTIDEIAMQTNLLALNAAVEAARAGEAGRGFAVVAEEVRNLAQRSAQAAKNTADLISESVKNAEEGVKISFDVSKSFESIADGNKKVNDLIAEIAAASQEQALGIDQVNSSVAQMDKVTQQNAANSEESASAAEQLSSQAKELQTMVEQFSLSNVAQATAAQPVNGIDNNKLNRAKSAPEKKTQQRKQAGAGRSGGNGSNKTDLKSAIPLEDDAVLQTF